MHFVTNLGFLAIGLLLPSNVASNPVSTGETSISPSKSDEAPGFPITLTLSPSGGSTAVLTTITGPPSNTDGPITSFLPMPTSLPVQACTVAMDNGNYILPLVGSQELLWQDGSTVTLFPDSIVKGFVTVAVPPCAAQTTLAHRPLDNAPKSLAANSPGDNHTIQIGPLAHTEVIDATGQYGLSFLITRFKLFAETLAKVVSDIDSFDEVGEFWANNAISDNEFSSAVHQPLYSATGNLSSFVGSMDFLQHQSSNVIHSLSKTGFEIAMNGFSQGMIELNVLQNLELETNSLPEMADDRKREVKDFYFIPNYAGYITIHMGKAFLEDFIEYDWDSEVQTESTTLSLSSSSSISSSTSSTSSSSTTSSSTTATPTTYLLTATEDTLLSTFQTYIKAFPDQGTGIQIVFPNVPFLTYLTNMTSEQATYLESQPWVRWIFPNTMSDDMIDVSSNNPNSTRLSRRTKDNPNYLSMEFRTESLQHLKMISIDKGLLEDGKPPKDDYLFDTKLGAGQTIYILDSGYNVDHIDFASDGRQVTSVEVPYEILMSATSMPRWTWVAPQIQGSNAHGTRVASVAGGVKAGVASRADLVLIKWRGGVEAASRNEVAIGVSDGAVMWAWEWIFGDVQAKRSNGYTGQFIINLSGGFSIANHQEKHRMFQSLIPRAEELDILVVLAAGNDGQFNSLNEFTPQVLGTPDNSVITVGGVDNSGYLDEITTHDAGLGGSLTLYAVSREIEAADWKINDKYTEGPRPADSYGTSYAAPAVAGLAAYYFSLPPVSQTLTRGQMAKGMKEYLIQHAQQRQANPNGCLTASYPAPDPASVKVAYNQGPDGLCSFSSFYKRELLAGDDSVSIHTRRQSDVDPAVVVNGTVTNSTAYNLYCSTPPPPPPQPIYTDLGLLSCGNHTNAGDNEWFFTLAHGQQGIAGFCAQLTNEDNNDMYWGPGSKASLQWQYTPQDDNAHPLLLNAAWGSLNDKGCPVFNPKDPSAVDVCLNRMGVTLNGCDLVQYNNEPLWKQGGSFFRDCMTWTLQRSPVIQP